MRAPGGHATVQVTHGVITRAGENDLQEPTEIAHHMPLAGADVRRIFEECHGGATRRQVRTRAPRVRRAVRLRRDRLRVGRRSLRTTPR